MKEKRYQDAVALRRALEARLKRQSETEATDLGRLRRRVVFDRIAARLSADSEAEWILKGRAALEFRLRNRARMGADAELYSVVRHVFTIRDTHAVPHLIPDPPLLWRDTYPPLAEGLTETTATLDSALTAVREFWARVVNASTGTED
ncbi:hypothetical protein ABZ848_00355 [Streptomyces sp. NPDC047081]|uniref:hypothetical protein n=1 Tax=Streptomyces sp. NPDC047081 TaxID=3154706 RepID=UPI0033DA89BD